MVDMLIVCLALLTVLAGWHTGGFRSALQFIFWLPAFALVVFVLYNQIQHEQGHVDELTLTVLKQVGIAYLIVSTTIWFLDKTIFKSIININFNGNERAIRNNKICGALVGVIKTYVVLITVIVFASIVNGGELPQWMKNNVTMNLVSKAGIPTRDFLVNNGYLTYTTVLYDRELEENKSRANKYYGESASGFQKLMLRFNKN